MKYDDLSVRMKENYEHRYRYFVPRRTYTILRLDGCHFHSYTKKLKKPFDYDLSNDIDNAIIATLPHIQGAVFAYTQSDEISILLTDFSKNTTSAWFDGNLQKICSVSASILTAEFNKLRLKSLTNIITHNFDPTAIQRFQLAFNECTQAYFDSRVFIIPDRTEVINYFVWRNNDASRNSVSMVAQSLFSHSELQNKSSNEMQEMIFTKTNINWSKYPEADKNGRLIVKESYDAPVVTTHIQSKVNLLANNNVKRSRWTSIPAWKFTSDMDKLSKMIPSYNL